MGLFSEVAMYTAQADGEQRMFSKAVTYMAQAEGVQEIFLIIKSKKSLTFNQLSKQDRVN